MLDTGYLIVTMRSDVQFGHLCNSICRQILQYQYPRYGQTMSDQGTYSEYDLEESPTAEENFLAVWLFLFVHN